jgi:peptidoglycan/LPS O-acetylase OafA/YrhL
MEKILAHFVYAQDLLDYGNIIPIFWTLCYEIQFYLVFVSALILARTLRIQIGEQTTHVIMASLGALSFLWSVIIFFSPVDTPIHGLFLSRWYQFFLGYLAMRCCLENRIAPNFIIGSVLILVASLLYSKSGADNGLSTLIVAWLLIAATKWQKMSIWLSGRATQFLGRISYSLYLIHSVVGWRFIKLLHKIHGADFTPLQAWLALGASVGISVLSAWMMYKLIEAPALKVCHQIRMDRPLKTGAFRKVLGD